jgi:hypothetical protein
LYFPELVDRVDRTLRTIADRDHRAVTGFALGGFAAMFTAGKFPDLVGSASAFDPTPEAAVGPRGLEVDYNPDDFYDNYEGVRTRQVTGPGDPLRYYHQRLDAIWQFARPHHEAEAFALDRAVQAIPKTLEFHRAAFATPLPKPTVFHHADPYPNFTVWGWQVSSDRRQPAYTVLQNVSGRGFRSSVREWAPSGTLLPAVKISILSPKLFPPGTPHTVTYLHVKDGKLRRATQKADVQGRMAFELDGDEWDVSLGEGPAVVFSGYELAGADWATAGQPLQLKVRFRNMGAVRSATASIQWESPNPGVKVEPASARLFALAPGEIGSIQLAVTVADPARRAVRLSGAEGTNRFSFVVPLFPAAEPARVFQIADGGTRHVWQHGNQPLDVPFGEGNHDGHASPGENFAILIPDGEWLRPAEVFTADDCVDLSMRASDSWTEFDRSGASVRYSLPAIRNDCEPGHVVHMLARVVYPGYTVRHFAIEFPVWYRQ